jgi:hypothetical protein|uniref:Uncharacterized protein n=1 Tax=viral metagenome TaxID=1070528 RepID=A0A6C0BKK7_9ZZZZ
MTENPRFADFSFFKTFLKKIKKLFLEKSKIFKKVLKNEKSANLGFSVMR